MVYTLQNREPSISCDWYDAAIPEGNFKAIVDGLKEVLSPNDDPCKVAGKNGYQNAVQLVSTNEGVKESRAFILEDNPLSPGRVYVSANGQAGGLARDFLIRNGIEHLVKRYDSAVDLSMTELTFSYRMAKLIRFIEDQKKPYNPQGTKEHGRTVMFNQRVKNALTSKNQKLPEAQVVFYEKGKEKGLPDMQDWKRIEMRLRPAKPDQQQAAGLLEPSEVWGAFKWTAAMLEIATAGSLYAGSAAYPRFQMSLPEVAEEMRKIRAMKTLQHMSDQYGRTYDTLVELCGEEEADRLFLSAIKRQREPDAKTPMEMYQDLYRRPETAH